MKRLALISTAAVLALGLSTAAIAGPGKSHHGKGPHPSASAWQNASENAAFKRDRHWDRDDWRERADRDDWRDREYYQRRWRDRDDWRRDRW